MPTVWKDDPELFALARRELFTAVVGDVMDKLGMQQQFLPTQFRPLHPEMVVIGRAMTVLAADCVTPDDNKSQHPLRRPFGLMLEALDDLKPHEVYVVSGAAPAYALWGELMSIRAQRLGAVGAVMEGYSRDTRGILKCGFPTFSFGPYAQDVKPRGKVIDFRVPIRIAGTHVRPGDVVFGDIDGVCIVPAEVCEEVFTRALEQARGENLVRSALLNGMTAVEAFDQYGIL